MPNNSPIITTIVGTGDAGFSGDNGPAIQATLREPFMCDFDTDGNLYVCEAKNHTVRKIGQFEYGSSCHLNRKRHHDQLNLEHRFRGYQHIADNISPLAGTGTAPSSNPRQRNLVIS